MSTAITTNTIADLFRSTKAVNIYPAYNEKGYALSYEDSKIAVECEYIPETEKTAVWDGFRDTLYWDAIDARLTNVYISGKHDTEMVEADQLPEWLYNKLVDLAIDDYNWNHAEPVDDEPEQWEAEMAYW